METVAQLTTVPWRKISVWMLLFSITEFYFSPVEAEKYSQHGMIQTYFLFCLSDIPMSHHIWPRKIHSHDYMPTTFEKPCLLYTHTKKDYSKSECIFSLLYKEEKLPTLIEVNLYLTFSMENAHLNVVCWIN